MNVQFYAESATQLRTALAAVKPNSSPELLAQAENDKMLLTSMDAATAAMNGVVELSRKPQPMTVEQLGPLLSNLCQVAVELCRQNGYLLTKVRMLEDAAAKKT